MENNVFSPDDAVTEYLGTTKLLSKDSQGISTLFQKHGVIVALESREGKRYRYLGWFCVLEEKKKMSAVWVYRGQFGKYHLWQTKDDELPE